MSSARDQIINSNYLPSNEPIVDTPMVLVMGGMEKNGTTSNQFNVLDVAFDEWWDLNLCGIARRNFAMEVVNGDTVYIFGGTNGFKALDLVTCLHLNSCRWSMKRKMATRRSFLASVQCGGKVYAIGGQDENTTQLTSVEVYDPQSDTWTFIEPMNIARSEASACISQGRIFVVGGHSYHFGTLACGEYYNLSSKIWTTIELMQSPRSNFSLVPIDKKIYAIGGWSFTSDDPLVDIEEYDISNNKWQTCGKLLEPRCNFASAALGTNVFIIGGHNLYHFMSSVEVWNCIKKRSHQLTPLPYETFGPSAVILPKSCAIFKLLTT